MLPHDACVHIFTSPANAGQNVSGIIKTYSSVRRKAVHDKASLVTLDESISGRSDAADILAVVIL